MRIAEEIAAAALEISSREQRQSFLENACAGDSNLRRRAESLLQAEAETDVARGITTEIGTTAPGPASSTEGPGTRVGPYKLLRIIGSGAWEWFG